VNRGTPRVRGVLLGTKGGTMGREVGAHPVVPVGQRCSRKGQVCNDSTQFQGSGIMPRAVGVDSGNPNGAVRFNIRGVTELMF
jgi:hypothetical protein